MVVVDKSDFCGVGLQYKYFKFSVFVFIAFIALKIEQTSTIFTFRVYVLVPTFRDVETGSA